MSENHFKTRERKKDLLKREERGKKTYMICEGMVGGYRAGIDRL